MARWDDAFCWEAEDPEVLKGDAELQEAVEAVALGVATLEQELMVEEARQRIMEHDLYAASFTDTL